MRENGIPVQAEHEAVHVHAAATGANLRSGDALVQRAACAITRREARAPQKGEGPRQVSLTGPIKSAMTYFPAEQYHRQQGLHFCVRDGNRCFPLLMVTDKSGRGLSAATG